jgi:hypothetical protein
MAMGYPRFGMLDLWRDARRSLASLVRTGAVILIPIRPPLRDRKFADSLLEEAVTSEPVSAGRIFGWC